MTDPTITPERVRETLAYADGFGWEAQRADEWLRFRGRDLARAYLAMAEEVERLRRGEASCVDDDGTPFASARAWRAANAEACRRLHESREEVTYLRAEVERLRRVLAVECGDESQAPEGWARMLASNGWTRSDNRCDVSGHPGHYTWTAWTRTDRWCSLDLVRGVEAYALDAMEAADAALEVTDG